MSKIRNYLIKHDKGFTRFLEILPGAVSWNLILFPYWGILVFPEIVAYTILGYNIYWFYQSLQIAITATVANLRTQASMKYDWLKDLKVFPDWKKVKQVIIVPTYKEPIHILRKTLQSVANQTLPQEQIHLILAMEKKEDKIDRDKKVKILKKEFGSKIKNFHITVHTLIPGEVAGKSSNEKHAAVWFKKNYIDKKGLDINHIVVTSCDADHIFNPNHMANLSYNFLDNPNRYHVFWQPALMAYSNIWEIPAIVRVVSTLGSIFNLSQQPRRDRLISTANYSLSFKMLHKVGYWHADRIPEDWGIFFKAYFVEKGEVEVLPIYLPIYNENASSTSFRKTIKVLYEQRKRWAWGVSDFPWIAKNYLLTPGVPFLGKTMRFIFLMQAHFLWPVHWFFITIGLQIPILLNPRFAETSLGYMVPKLSSFILTVALLFLLVMLVLDRLYKPPRPKHIPFWKELLHPLEFVLMPIAGFIFVALPGIDAHTRLMLGKYIEYKVTEKV